MAQDTLSRVNKKMGANRAGLRQKVSVPVLIAWVLLLAYGAFVIGTASLTIAEASFTRQLVGIGLGQFMDFLCWRTDFSGLAGMTTVLLVIDLIVLFSPYIPGLSYNAKGMTGWIKIPLIGLDFSGLAGMTTVLLVIDLIVLFSPYIPGLSYNAKGMTGWIKIPLIGLTFQPVELAKLITIFFVASLGAQYNGRRMDQDPAYRTHLPAGRACQAHHDLLCGLARCAVQRSHRFGEGVRQVLREAHGSLRCGRRRRRPGQRPGDLHCRCRHHHDERSPDGMCAVDRGSHHRPRLDHARP